MANKGLTRELQEALYDPKKMTWKQFIASHKSWRTPKGLLDLKRIAAAWKEYKKGNEKAFDVRGIRDYLRRQGIEADLHDIEAEYDHSLSHSENLKQLKQRLGLGRKGYHDYARMQKNFYRGQGILAGAPQDVRGAAFADMGERGTLRGYDTAPRTWIESMKKAIKKATKAKDPSGIVKNLWKKLSPKSKKAIIDQAAAGKKFKFNLPKPDDRPAGPGTIRTVKPFDLSEIQVNVSKKVFEYLKRTGLYDTMKREDGSQALVKRCKSSKGNCNLFIDKAR